MLTAKITSYAGSSEHLPLRGAEEIIDTLDQLNVRLGEFSEEFVVIGGANLVLRGLRNRTTDIDILTSVSAFEKMHELDGALVKLPPKRAIAQGATNTSVWINSSWTKVPLSAATDMGDGYYPMSYQQYDSVELERIEGHPIVPLDHVWNSKVALQRPKDLSDLQIIAEATGRDSVLPAPTYKGPFLDS